MSRLLKPLTDWTEDDLLALVTEQIEEGQRLEYKRELVLGARSQNAEAGKDASGMANALGGLVIYGMDEQELPDGRRIPVALAPFPDGGAQARLEDVLYSSVSPRLNLATRLIPASSGGFFLLVRVQQRSGPLHMVEGQGQHRYFMRHGLATRPMAAHEVEAAFRALASTAAQVETEATDLPLVPRISRTRSRNTESGALEPGERPWISVVAAPHDPGATLAMRAPSSVDFPVSGLPGYLRDGGYLSNGAFQIHDSGYVDQFEDDFLHRTLRLYRNGWCEWGYRYSLRPGDEDGNRIPGLVLLANVHDALLYIGYTYRERGYYGRLRLWVRIDNADKSSLIGHRGPVSAESPSAESLSFESDTNVEALSTDAERLAIVHAAMDRIWQGYGLPRCSYFSPEGQLIADTR
jgi:hypothetical protein